ncbi:MAG TPA: allantoinase AllB [Phycisphaerae bacterium]|nr:allantoinase AllB [Phycisphaerae bacterium]
MGNSAMGSERFALRSRRVVTPEGCDARTIVVSGGRIEALSAYDAAVDCPVRDAGDLVVLPGLVDTHVHVNDPDGPPRVGWEGFETATRAAAAGGITTLVDMPLNSTPVTTSVAALEKKRASASGRIHVDVGFHGGLVHDNTSEINGLLDAGVLGIKAFLVHSGIDDFPAAGEAELRAVAPLLKKHGVALLAHAELDHIPPASLPNEDPRSYARYLASRPANWETSAIRLLLDIAKQSGVHVHVVHLATEEALPDLIAARDYRVPVTVETCPHYLYFAAEEIADGATQFKCAPPIREARTRAALWKALRSGDIDMIASDHSPCPPDLKRLDTGDFTKSWGGISSLQLTLPITWTAAMRFNPATTFNNLAQWLSTFPAKLVGLQQKGAIVAGKDADFVLFDPDAAFTVEAESLHHRHKLTPYAGQTLRGVAVQTYLRGRIVHERGQFPVQPAGQLLARAT